MVMQEVAHHLQLHAKQCSEKDRDAFARSAYNRYYYSSFLIIRALFSQMNPSWSRTAHKNYPTTLKGEISKRLKQAYSRADKINDHQAIKDIRTAQRAIPHLCKIIEEAYNIRVVADYNPEVQVCFSDDNKFSLSSINIDIAYKWKDNVQTLSATILAAWKHIDD